MSVIFTSEPVIIEDDDTDTEPIEIPEEDVKEVTTKEKPVLDTITIDIDSFEPEVISTQHDNVSEVNQNTIIDNSENSFVNALTNNVKMNKIVKWCLNAPNNIGMKRIIHKTLLPLYEDSQHDFKESTQLTEILNKALKSLKHDPNHKFLHIKVLCENLKNGQFRKKVPFKTLSTSKRKDKKKKKKIKKSSPRKTKSPLKTFGMICNINNLTKYNNDIVVLDKSDDEIISLDDDVIVNTENSCADISNKENKVDSNDNIELTDHRKPPDRRFSTETASNGKDKIEEYAPNLVSETKINENEESALNLESESVNEDLLVPQKEEHNDEVNSSLEIKLLEERIASHKRLIARWEEQEVCDDSESSPYVICHNLKREILVMYKKICKLTDSSMSLVKRREVRLKVKPGHPPGPARRLELFLNDSIDDTGMVAFPDFQDVVACVTASNEADKLNWNKQRITTEALALFRQCGQALRKQRQKREYRDLMSLVQSKPTLTQDMSSDDPADRDPELLAKLERNKRIAMAKEDELLERYTNYQSSSTKTPATSHDNPIDYFTHNSDPEIANRETYNEYENRESSKDNTRNLNKCGDSEESSLVLCMKNGRVSVVPDNNEQNYVKISEKNNKSKTITLDPLPVENEQHRRVTTSFSPFPSEDKVEIEIDFNTVDVKTEKDEQIRDGTSEFQSMLDNLGDNYTCSVYDIEDPFLVIEISSDESSSDEL